MMLVSGSWLCRKGRQVKGGRVRRVNGALWKAWGIRIGCLVFCAFFMEGTMCFLLERFDSGGGEVGILFWALKERVMREGQGRCLSWGLRLYKLRRTIRQKVMRGW